MILLFGAGGQVAHALISSLQDQKYHALTRAEADLSEPASITQALEHFRPALVLNAAAYTQVDKAETERETALKVNADAPGIMARWCADNNAALVHYSTDYVFSGEGETPWREEDATAPVNAYGESKRAGEEAIVKAGGRFFIFRTSWVYDATGKNFFNTMLRLGREREELAVVEDQRGAPTYAPHLARATMQALVTTESKEIFPSGIYHLCNAGVTSWHEFACGIFDGARACEEMKVRQVRPIPSSAYPTPAKRPHNSRLNCEKAKRMLGVALPAWEVGLRECLKEKYEDHGLPSAGPEIAGA